MSKRQDAEADGDSDALGDIDAPADSEALGDSDMLADGDALGGADDGDAGVRDWVAAGELQAAASAPTSASSTMRRLTIEYLA